MTLSDRERQLARRCARRAKIAGVVYIVVSVWWLFRMYVGDFADPLLPISMVLGGFGIMLRRAGRELGKQLQQGSPVDLERIAVVFARIYAVRVGLASTPFVVVFIWILMKLS